MADVPLAILVSSPLRRCRQTAQALVDAHGETVPTAQSTQGLIECGYGDWTGQEPDGAEQGEALDDGAAAAVGGPVPRRRGDDRDGGPGGRRDPALGRRLTAEHGPHAVWAAVSHGDVIKAILADALGMHLDSFQRILVDPASVSVVRYTDARPYVVTIELHRRRPGRAAGPAADEAAASVARRRGEAADRGRRPRSRPDEPGLSAAEPRRESAG